MSGTALLVDFENIQKLDLSRLPAGMRVRIFVGATQSKVPFDLTRQAQALGSRLEWVRIDGQGRNALDFHIAFYAGELLAKEPRTEVVILSSDTGFDPLVRHLLARKFVCRRITHASSLETAPKATLETNAKKARELLKSNSKDKRPRSRKALTSHVTTHFAKLSAAEVAEVIRQLFEAQLITETDKSLDYHF